MPSIDHDELRDYGFADQALALRKRAGLTQREVADLLGVSLRTIRAWESGLSYPRADSAARTSSSLTATRRSRVTMEDTGPGYFAHPRLLMSVRRRDARRATEAAR